jgi:hypothetical protein
VQVGTSCYSFGTTDAFAPFPFNALIDNFSATINGMQLKTNLEQYKDIFLRTISPSVLQKSASYAPSLLNQPFYKYRHYIGTNTNVFSTAINQSYDHRRTPRGAYDIDSLTVVHNITGGGTNTSTISTNTGDA